MICRSPNNEKEWEQYYDLRYSVLRKPLGQEPGSEQNEGDKTGEHFALFDLDNIIAVGRLDFNNEEVGQVRFVAVHPEYQGQGKGKLLMRSIESRAKYLGLNKIVLHARENALDFYERLNYTQIKKSHLLLGQVQHYFMVKEL